MMRFQFSIKGIIGWGRISPLTDSVPLGNGSSLSSSDGSGSKDQCSDDGVSEHVVGVCLLVGRLRLVVVERVWWLNECGKFAEGWSWIMSLLDEKRYYFKKRKIISSSYIQLRTPIPAHVLRYISA